MSNATKDYTVITKENAKGKQETFVVHEGTTYSMLDLVNLMPSHARIMTRYMKDRCTKAGDGNGYRYFKYLIMATDKVQGSILAERVMTYIQNNGPAIISDLRKIKPLAASGNRWAAAREMLATNDQFQQFAFTFQNKTYKCCYVGDYNTITEKEAKEAIKERLGDDSERSFSSRKGLTPTELSFLYAKPVVNHVGASA